MISDFPINDTLDFDEEGVDSIELVELYPNLLLV